MGWADEAAELWQRPEWSDAGVNLTKMKQKTTQLSSVKAVWFMHGIA